MTPFNLIKTVTVIGLIINIILSVYAITYIAKLDEYREFHEARSEIEKAMVCYYYQQIVVEQKADKADKKRAKEYIKAIKTPVSEFGLPYQNFIIKIKEEKEK